MSTTHCVWDGNSQTELVYDDELDYNNLWEPWKNTIVSVKTATTNISHLQKIAKRKNKQIKTENIAQALENINLLQHTITIQIASNGNFVSIEFDKQEIMEQFCCKPLSIHGFNVTFYPERRKKRPPPRRLMNVSFINIPPETPEEIVMELLEQYADIEGTPMYVKKSHNGRTYCTGTRVYPIHKLYQHIPRRLPNTFGRTIVCIYDIQPEQQEYNQQRRQRQPRNKTPIQQQTTEQPTSTDTDSDENTDNQWQQQRYYRKKQNQQKRKQTNKIHNNITQRRDKRNYQIEQQPPDINDENYPQLSQQQHQNKDTATPSANTPPEQENNAEDPTIILENNNQNYPQLPQQQNQNKDTTTTITTTPAEEITVIPETNPIPTTQQEEIYNSPSLVTKHRNELIQQTPEPKNIATPETPSDNKRNKITPKTKKQSKDEVKTYRAKKFSTQLQQTDFCDIGRLTKATEQERNNMIAISMYDRLGLFDPSNEYVINYKNRDILQKYKEISKDRPTKTNNLIQVYDIIKNIELRG